MQRTGDVGGGTVRRRALEEGVGVLVVPELHEDREDPVRPFVLEVDELARGHLDDPVLDGLLPLEDLLEGDLTLGVLLLHQVGLQVVALAGAAVSAVRGWNRPPGFASAEATVVATAVSARLADAARISARLPRGEWITGTCVLPFRKWHAEIPERGARRCIPKRVANGCGRGASIVSESFGPPWGISQKILRFPARPQKLWGMAPEDDVVGGHARRHCDILLMSLWCLP